MGRIRDYIYIAYGFSLLGVQAANAVVHLLNFDDVYKSTLNTASFALMVPIMIHWVYYGIELYRHREEDYEGLEGKITENMEEHPT